MCNLPRYTLISIDEDGNELSQDIIAPYTADGDNCAESTVKVYVECGMTVKLLDRYFGNDAWFVFPANS